jgi:hypothetical protein
MRYCPSWMLPLFAAALTFGAPARAVAAEDG